jgi:hypothetical protein
MGIECQIGSANGDQTFHLWPQPNDATTAEIGVVGHRDEREGPPTQRMTRISNSDSLL